MPALKLLTRLALYYLLMAGALLTVLWLNPDLQQHLPIGRVQALLQQSGSTAPLDILAVAQPAAPPSGAPMPSFLGSLIWLGAAIIGALLAALPVSWVYMNIRSSADYDQSLVDTIVILPLVVTSIVVIVQHSLALAFSLAGIAGAARYRNTLKSSGDLLFILLAIGIGLSAGIGAVELAMLSSAAFNICFILLWATNYGERQGMKRFLEDAHPHGPPKEPQKEPQPDDPNHDRRMKQSDWNGL